MPLHTFVPKNPWKEQEMAASQKKTTEKLEGMDELLKALQTTLASVGEEKTLAEGILEVLRIRFGGEHGLMLEHEETTGGLREVAKFGEIEEMLEQDMRIFAQYATDHPEDPDSVLMTRQAKNIKKLAARKSVRRDMTKEVLIFPLVSGENAMGAIYLGSTSANGLALDTLDENKALAVGATLGEILAIDRALGRLNRQNKALQRQVQKDSKFEDIIGTSEAVTRVKNALELVAETDIPVTLIGEVGTGKTAIAQIVHQQSHRSENPYVVFDAAEVPEKIMAGVLFGLVKGVRRSFSKGRLGSLREAKGGTLYVKDIDLLPTNIQTQLVNAVERGEMIAIGDEVEYLVDVRLVISTTGNIKELHEKGALTEDLYKYMKQFPILVPPLRNRAEDLPLLVPYYAEEAAASFGKSIAGISTDVYDFFGTYHWPGNLAELEREVRQAVLRTPDRTGMMNSGSLSMHLVSRQQPTIEDTGEGTLKQRVARIEKKMIIDALEKHNHNQSTTAETLGLSRQALINKLHRYGIETGRKYKRKMREIEKQAGKES
ncbi:hypothetical protein GF324_12740 [bacterium]|nr:hypothetical protein [bacterium]